MHVISRNREQTAAAEPRADARRPTVPAGRGEPAGADAASKPYLRHTPDVDRSTGTARRWRRRAVPPPARRPGPRPGADPCRPRGAEPSRARTARPEQPGPNSGPNSRQPKQLEAEQPSPAPSSRSSPTTCRTSSSRCSPRPPRRVRGPAGHPSNRRRGAWAGRRAARGPDRRGPRRAALRRARRVVDHVDLVGPHRPSRRDLAGVLRDVREVVHDARPWRARPSASATAPRRRPFGGADHSTARTSRTCWLARRRALHVPRAPLPDRLGRPVVPEGRGLACSATPAARRDPGPGAGDPGTTGRFQRGLRTADLLVFTGPARRARLRPVQPYYLAGPGPRRHRAGGRRAPVPGMLTVAALYENVLDTGGGAERAGGDPPGRVPAGVYSGQQMLEVISALHREGCSARPRSSCTTRRSRARRGRAPRGAGVPAPRPVPPLHSASCTCS